MNFSTNKRKQKLSTIFCWIFDKIIFAHPPPPPQQKEKQTKFYGVYADNVFETKLTLQFLTVYSTRNLQKISEKNENENQVWRCFAPKICRKNWFISVTLHRFYWSHEVEPTFEKKPMRPVSGLHGSKRTEKLRMSWCTKWSNWSLKFSQSRFKSTRKKRALQKVTRPKITGFPTFFPKTFQWNLTEKMRSFSNK